MRSPLPLFRYAPSRIVALVPLAALLILVLVAPSIATADREIPILVEEEEAGVSAGKTATIVSAAPAKPAAKPAAKQPGKAPAADAAASVKSAAPGEARKLRGGEPVDKLVKTFEKYRPDAEIDPAAYDEKRAGFDAARADLLAARITDWKKLRLDARAQKGKDEEKFEQLVRKVRALEDKILADFGAGASIGKPAVAADEPAPPRVEAGKAVAVDAARTAEARRMIERTRDGDAAAEPKRGPRATNEDDEEEDLRAARDGAEQRLEKVRREREGSKYMPSKLRLRPARVLFNRLDPGGEERGALVIRNAGRTPFEGAVVAIEEWISVSPPTVYIEPNAELELDVHVSAPDKKNARIEGSIEIRSVGESSRRVPVVLRTTRK